MGHSTDLFTSVIKHCKQEESWSLIQTSKETDKCSSGLIQVELDLSPWCQLIGELNQISEEWLLSVVSVSVCQSHWLMQECELSLLWAVSWPSEWSTSHQSAPGLLSAALSAQLIHNQPHHCLSYCMLMLTYLMLIWEEREREGYQAARDWIIQCTDFKCLVPVWLLNCWNLLHL